MNKILADEDGDTIWNDPFGEDEGSDLVALDPNGWKGSVKSANNPPKQAGTTPSTDLSALLDLVFQKIPDHHLLPQFREKVEASITEVITQERNKAKIEVIKLIAPVGIMTDTVRKLEALSNELGYDMYSGEEKEKYDIYNPKNLQAGYRKKEKE